MHRIPKDIALIVYRMVHIDFMQSCIDAVDDMRDGLGVLFNYRELGINYANMRVCSIYKHQMIMTRGTIPANYIYSSGLNNPLGFSEV